MLVVDRESFIAWTEGILLQRDKDKIVVGDNALNKKAEELLEKGDMIGLTVEGHLVSFVRLTDRGYEEAIATGEEMKS